MELVSKCPKSGSFCLIKQIKIGSPGRLKFEKERREYFLENVNCPFRRFQSKVIVVDRCHLVAGSRLEAMTGC